DVRALERAEQARLAAEAVETRLAGGGGRGAEHRPDAVALDNEELVLRTAGESCQCWCPVTWQLFRVHPAAEGGGVERGSRVCRVCRVGRVGHGLPREDRDGGGVGGAVEVRVPH